MKNLGIVQAMTRAATSPVPVTDALLTFPMASESGMRRDDVASVARLYPGVAGVTRPVPKA